MNNYFAELFEGALIKLKEELNKFKDESNIWLATDGVTNSAGTLTLHLLGNLNFNFGTHLGHNGYVRNREQEFSLTGVPRETLVADIEKTIELIKSSLETVDQAQLDAIHTVDFLGAKSTGWYLTFFYGHFTYHLGQINYLRRILEAE
jgi:hypothetical protein